MKKAYLLMLFLLVSASASAEWSHFYVDNASIQAVDGKRHKQLCP